MGTVLSGQDLYDRTRIRLGALANAFTVDEVLSFCEDGVQEVWAVLKSFDQDYFGESSQDTDSTQDTFFADLNPTTREYALPAGCREIRSIENLTTGFESTVFEYKKFDDPLFQTARRDATAMGAPGSSNRSGSSLGNYYYTVFGTQFILAQWPEANFNIKLWFIFSLNAITTDTQLSDILYPFSGKIVDYSVQRALASAREVEMTEEWMNQWRESIKTLGMSSAPRSSTGPTMVSDYLGT